jgi:hypothetical protein
MNDPGKCYRLGRAAHRDGNFMNAAIYFRRAAEGGHVRGMRMFADFLYRGVGIERNESRGLAFYRKAAESGSREAKRVLIDLELDEMKMTTTTMKMTTTTMMMTMMMMTMMMMMTTTTTTTATKATATTATTAPTMMTTLPPKPKLSTMFMRFESKWTSIATATRNCVPKSRACRPS